MATKPTIGERNGEFTSNLLGIMNMHAATVILDRVMRQHITSHSTKVPVDPNSTNH